MTARITNSMITSSTLADVNSSLAAMERSASELSSGKSILQPSDNPYGASQAIGLQSTLDGLKTFEGNVQDGTAWLNTASSSLGSINGVVQRVRELVVQAANGVNGQSDLNGIAEEVDQLTETVKQDANAEYGGQHIFSGTATNVAPYEQGAGDEYKGDAGSVTRVIAPGSSVQANTDISALLGNGVEAGDGKLLDTLRTISLHLRAGTTEARNELSAGDLKSIDTNLASLTKVQANVGARTNQLQMAASRILDLQTTTSQALSNTQDADFAKTSITYSSQQAAYNAALRAGANIVQESLLNFLH